MSGARRVYRRLSLLLACVLICLPTTAFAAGTSLAGDSVAGDSLAGTSVGINGHYRAGQWTAVRMPARVQDAVIETTDGDGTPVIYEQNFLPLAENGQSPRFGYCVPGTEAAPLVVRPRSRGADEAKPAYLTTRFPELATPADGPAMIPTEMAWVAVFGDPLGIQTIGANELLRRDASIAVTRISSAEAVPDHVLGLAGLDMILITGSGAEVLQRLSDPQATAIANWVRGGGRIMVTLGATAETVLRATPWLAKLLPEDVSRSSLVRMDPAGLETFTSSQTRLPGFDAWQLPRAIGAGGVTLSSVGEVLIAGRTEQRIGSPLAVRYTVGLGKITVLAADLDAEPFVNWSERLELVTKLTGNLLTENRGELGSNFRLSGYADLAGQVRRSLDQFPIKRHFSFAVIALIITGLLVLVAPLDYLLVRRVLGNPLLGWLTFPIVAVVLSVALVLAARPRIDSPSLQVDSQSASAPESAKEGAKMSQMRANAIELLDLDSATQTGRLFRWSFLYSHPAQSVRVVAQQSEALKSIVDHCSYQMLAPFGAPGQSMGGIQIDSWNAPLQVPIQRTVHSPASGTPPDDAGASGLDEPQRCLTSHIEDLELAPRSSKSIALQMQFTSAIDAEPMQRRRGSELLQGRLSNPLDIDLLDSMLIYQNLVYLLPTRFPAGETVGEVDALRQKNFRWQLSRQRALESSSQTEAWDVIRTDQTERLAEMLMFHDVVGGLRYTGLQSEILGHLDLTDLLTKDQCILVGRCAQPWVAFGVSESDQAAAPSAPQGENHTWVRVILPVAEVQR